MKNDEAKFILSGYRPSGADGTDAMFCEALRQAQSDPELAGWFGRSRAYDAAVAGKLGEIAPPAGLREAILAGGRVSRAKESVWRRPAWMAAAAAVAVIGVSTAALWPRGAQADEALVQFAMSDAREVTKHGGHGDEARSLQGELGSAGQRLDHGLRVDFAALARSGCRTVPLGDRRVLEVCFERNGTWFHCYIARVEDFPELAAKQAPLFAQNGGMHAVSWADGAHRFVVAGPAGREALERLL